MQKCCLCRLKKTFDQNEDDCRDDVVILFEKSESNVLKEVCEDSDEVYSLSSPQKKESEKFVDTNCCLSKHLRKTCINDETFDTKDSSSHVNCLFKTIKQSDVAMKVDRKDHKLMNCPENMKNDIINDVVGVTNSHRVINDAMNDWIETRTVQNEVNERN